MYVDSDGRHAIAPNADVASGLIRFDASGQQVARLSMMRRMSRVIRCIEWADKLREHEEKQRQKIDQMKEQQAKQL